MPAYSPGYAASVLADSPIGYWRLEEPSGAVAANEVGGGDAGTYAGTGWTRGIASLLTPLDRAGDHAVSSSGTGNTGVTLPTAAPFNLTTLAVECWFRCTAPGSSYRGLVVKNNTFGLFVKDNILLAFDVGGAADRTTSVNVADGVAHHVVYNHASTVVNGSTIYLDGALAATFTATNGTNTEPPVFAAGNNPVTTQQYAGAIDEVAIYPALLTAARIRAHWEAGKGILAGAAARPTRSQLAAVLVADGVVGDPRRVRYASYGAATPVPGAPAFGVEVVTEAQAALAWQRGKEVVSLTRFAVGAAIPPQYRRIAEAPAE